MKGGKNQSIYPFNTHLPSVFLIPVKYQKNKKKKREREKTKTKQRKSVGSTDTTQQARGTEKLLAQFRPK